MRLHLTERKAEVPGVESFVFKPAEPLAWKAGQFLHYVLHHEPTDDRGSDRWFTNSAAPSEGKVMITTRFTNGEKGSTFKSMLKGLKVGDMIEISDVDGDFTVEDPSKDYVFIAGGIGITPFRSILAEADHSGTPLRATLLYANRDANFPFKEEFDAIAARNPNFIVHYLVDPERIDADSVRKYVPDLEKPVFYVSGPEPMVEALGAMLKGLGIPPERLKQDWFPGYPAE